MSTISLWYTAEQHRLLPTVRPALGMAVRLAVATLCQQRGCLSVPSDRLPPPITPSPLNSLDQHLSHSVCMDESPDSVGLEHF